MSNIRLAICAVGIILIAVCGYTGGVLATRKSVGKTRLHTTNSRPKVWDRTPQVDGEIMDCLPSPDCSRIAVLYWKSAGDCAIPLIAVFDPVKRKVLGETDAYVGAPSAPWTWSPDSRWLTIPEEDPELRMISRDGQTKVVTTKKMVADIVWREDQPSKFLYTSFGPDVYEYDLNKKSERSIKTEFAFAEWLFVLDRKPCVTGIGKDGGGASTKACWVDTGKTVIEITTPKDSEHSSIEAVELSPDGRFVSLVYRNGIRELGIIARTKDVGSVLTDRSRALFVEELSNPDFRVVWPTDYPNTSCIVEGRTVDLADGCLRHTYQGVRQLAHWTPTTRNDKQTPRWLETCGFGLGISTDNEPRAFLPMLRHKPLANNN